MTTTFETSKQLKDAGFPQAKCGSWWLMGHFYFDPPSEMIDVFVEKMADASVFAPTAEKILAELPSSFRLGANVFERDGKRHVEFVAWNVVDDDEEVIADYHANAAEALARVWLDWNRVKKRAEQETPSGA